MCNVLDNGHLAQTLSSTTIFPPPHSFLYYQTFAKSAEINRPPPQLLYDKNSSRSFIPPLTSSSERLKAEIPATMPVSVLDSRIWRNIFGTEDIRLIFEDKSYAYYMITVEAALARAQSKIGIIPPNVGEEISRSCHANKLEYVPTPDPWC